LSQSCIKTPLKVFLARIFKYSDRNDLIFFGHFKNISVYDRKKSASKYARAPFNLGNFVFTELIKQLDCEYLVLTSQNLNVGCQTTEKFLFHTADNTALHLE